MCISNGRNYKCPQLWSLKIGKQTQLTIFHKQSKLNSTTFFSEINQEKNAKRMTAEILAGGNVAIVEMNAMNKMIAEDVGKMNAEELIVAEIAMIAILESLILQIYPNFAVKIRVMTAMIAVWIAMIVIDLTATGTGTNVVTAMEVAEEMTEKKLLRNLFVLRR